MISEATRRIYAPGGQFSLDSLIAALEEVRFHQRAVGIASPVVLCVVS